mgnify:CR=1 FL=1
MNKQNQLNILKNKLKEIKFDFFKGNLVFNDGNINSELMLIGEAPGKTEDKQSKPFAGKSGTMLRELLDKAKINDIYMTNVIPFHPPNNRTPNIKEINLMKPYIKEHISIIKPKIIVAAGLTCLKCLGINKSLSSVQGKGLIQTELGNIYPIFHPAYLIRNRKIHGDFFQSLLNLKKIIQEQNI